MSNHKMLSERYCFFIILNIITMNKFQTYYLELMMNLFPSERRYKYKLVKVDRSYIENDKLVNKNIAGIKLTYKKIHQVPTLLKIGKFKINLFPKNTNQQFVHFWQPLKEHYPTGGKKIPYEASGNSKRITINQWFLINKNFNDFYKEQFFVEIKDIITKTSNLTLFKLLEYNTKQFYIKY